jgi:hypothetical protein
MLFFAPWHAIRSQSKIIAQGLAARDTDLQEKALGKDLAFDAGLRGSKRGDLVFWPGHVGIMRDETVLLHANVYHMIVVNEDLRIAQERIWLATSKPISAIKRLTEASV